MAQAGSARSARYRLLVPRVWGRPFFRNETRPVEARIHGAGLKNRGYKLSVRRQAELKLRSYGRADSTGSVDDCFPNGTAGVEASITPTGLKNPRYKRVCERHAELKLRSYGRAYDVSRWVAA